MRWNSALIAATASVFASSATAAFNAASNTNMVMYWGQGYDQIPLEDVCNDDSIDIVVIGFINGFPKKVGDYPASNFAKDCGASYYPNPDGTGPSKLFDSCPSIGPGIKSCQNKGKKVFLSIGGGWPTDYYIPNQDVAKYFADFLWGAFGPQTAKWVADKKPRPFGDAAVDGFDLDIESYIEPAPFTSYQYANYGTLVTQLKKNVYPNGLQPLISGAPQCVIPDARLADAIKVSKFDFLFIQFYNNGAAGCGTRAGYEGLSKKTTTFTFDNWITWLRSNSNNKEVKVYIGMPAGIAAVPNDEASYLQPSEASALIKTYYNKYPTQFGGVMLWEATVSARNKICDKPYGTTIKRILNAVKAKTPFDLTCPRTTSSAIPTTTSPSSSRSSVVSTTRSSTLSSSSYVVSTTRSSTSISSTPVSTSTRPATTTSSSLSSLVTSSSSSTITSSSSSSSTSSSPSSSSTSSSPSSSSTPSSPSIDPMISTSVDPTVSTSVDPTVSTSVDPTISTSVDPTVSTSVDPTVSTSVDPTVSTSVDPTISTSVDPTVSTSVDPTISTSVDPTVSTSVDTTPSTPVDANTSTTMVPNTSTSVGPTTSNGASASGTQTSTTSISTASPHSATSDASGAPSSSPSSAAATKDTYGSSTLSSTTTCIESSAYPSETSSTDVPKASTSTSIMVYPSSVASPSETSPISSDTVVYPTITEVPSMPTYPGSSTSTSTVATVVITTSYIDICPTGFTTIVTTITTTVCPEATASATGVPAGWYTTVTACDHCGPKPTMVTLTKPSDAAPPTISATSTTFISQYITVHASPAPSAAAPSIPGPNAPAAGPGAPHASSNGGEGEYTPVPNAPSSIAEEDAHTPAVYEYSTDAAKSTHMSTTVELIYNTKVPVAPSVAPSVPYTNVQGSGAYAPGPTGAASSTGSAPKGTSAPILFEGAASRFGTGMSMVAVVVAGLLLL